MAHEYLEEIARGIPVEFKSDMPKGLKGVYMNGVIYLRDGMAHYETIQVLSEEVGHHFTSAGDITDYDDIMNMKQEVKARRYGYELLITLDGLVDAFKAAVRTVYELAEHFDVTTHYIEQAIEHYRMKFGHYTYHNNYLIYFHPNLRVIELKKFH